MLVQGGYGPRRLRGRTGRLVCRLFPRPPTYDITVTKGSINMFTSTIRSKAQEGWKLDHLFEQQENKIAVWRRDPQ